MAWEYTDIYGVFHSDETWQLKRNARDGIITRATEVVSTTTGKRGLAGEIKGLQFDVEDWGNQPVPPVQEVPNVVNAERTRLPVNDGGFKYQPRKGPVRTANPGFFDLQFNDAITPTLVSALWALWLSVVILGLLVGLGLYSVGVWQDGGPWGLRVAKILGAGCLAVFFWLFLSILVRIVLESAVVLFRIADYLKQISQR